MNEEVFLILDNHEIYTSRYKYQGVSFYIFNDIFYDIKIIIIQAII